MTFARAGLAGRTRTHSGPSRGRARTTSKPRSSACSRTGGSSLSPCEVTVRCRSTGSPPPARSAIVADHELPGRASAVTA
jgi:hypothetical protein